MAYFDRLGEASYESPSGRSFSFSYRTAAREIVHRVGSFEFPGIKGTLHQDKSVSGQVFPWTIYIHGPNYDLVADEFFKAVSETGQGFLNHPRYGRLRVQILTVAQNEDLTKDAGQAVFSINLQESLEREFPEVDTALQKTVPAQADGFQDTAVQNYADQVIAESLSDINAITQAMTISIALVNQILAPVASLADDVAAQFSATILDMETNIDTYIDDPAAFATGIIGSIRVVSTIGGAVGSVVAGYTSLLAAIPRGILVASNAERNALLIDELVGTSAVVAMSESINTALGESSSIAGDGPAGAVITVPVVGVGFQTRSEALSAAILIRDSFEGVVGDLDDGQVVFGAEILSAAYVQSIDSYGASSLVASSTIKATLDLAFSLPAERILTLEADSTLINLCYELYGNIDDSTLDYFILTNNLSGAEIKTVPRGRQVVYYA